ncbi:hypothetical protein [Jannaschia pohangensis]|uniref:Uncharacterized protein n=1 Tax=Jannaschia pohangensis TaxID=390807 RepID=A0A1I3SL50_9RHOB|nr:hypothetical protein [Jannaschia pohangensis]SFJ59538.1 hypothetical protein SAMN04488095_3198 [Jannaschia pohangensis]
MLRLPLIVLMLTSGIAQAQSTQGQSNGNGQPVQVQDVQNVSQPSSGGQSSVVDPVGTPNSGSTVILSVGDSLYLSEEFFSEGSIENGTNRNVDSLTAISASDIVWEENGNFEAATLALGECNPGSTWNPETADCRVSGGN